MHSANFPHSSPMLQVNYPVLHDVGPTPPFAIFEPTFLITPCQAYTHSICDTRKRQEKDDTRTLDLSWSVTVMTAKN
jgi:hypothetical protein